MMWSWNRKKKKKVMFHSMSVPALIRQSIYDTMLTPAEGIANAMGLPPISEEVSEMEERASDERIGRISALLPFIDSHSEITANIVSSAYFLESDKIDDITPEEMSEMTRLFKLVALAATVSGISTLVDLELIEVHANDDNE